MNVKVTNGFADQMEQGVYDNKNGTVTVVKVGGSGFVSLKKLGKRADKSMAEYAKNNNLSYKFISEQTRKMSIGVFPKSARIYQILNADGSKSITRDQADTKLKELKEQLDLGLINQSDFDEKAIEYKKVILGNHP